MLEEPPSRISIPGEINLTYKSYMVDEIIKHISSFDTSRKVWVKLKKTFASNSINRAIEFKEVKGLKKDNLSITDYVLKNKIAS